MTVRVRDHCITETLVFCIEADLENDVSVSDAESSGGDGGRTSKSHLYPYHNCVGSVMEEAGVSDIVKRIARTPIGTELKINS
jgi:hypothetical protein